MEREIELGQSADTSRITGDGVTTTGWTRLRKTILTPPQLR